MKQHRRKAPKLALLSMFALLSGCNAIIDQASFFPPAVEAPKAALAAPAGYSMEEALLDLPGLGKLHAVRLDNSASDATIIYSGGNHSFVSVLSPHAAALAKATGADLILYDYPGRGGTTVAPTIDASIETGLVMLRQLRERGWIGNGPLFAYGLSFGGSQAAAMVREGGFTGLMIEGSAADIVAVGRNFVPTIAKPFVKLKVDPALHRFDYLGYATAAKTPVLLISSRDDDTVRDRNMRDFAEQIKARGAPVTFVSVPGGHGTALGQPAALAAIKSFVESRSGN
jgi:pimeloyl-ACP methyl ester carboxylesterase